MSTLRIQILHKDLKALYDVGMYDTKRNIVEKQMLAYKKHYDALMEKEEEMQADANLDQKKRKNRNEEEEEETTHSADTTHRAGKSQKVGDNSGENSVAQKSSQLPTDEKGEAIGSKPEIIIDYEKRNFKN